MDDDPMAIARSLQASFVSSGTHRGEGSLGGRSGRGGSRARGGGRSSRGGGPPRLTLDYGSVPARSSLLNPMTCRAVQPASRLAPAAAGGDLGGRVAPAPAASTRVLPVRSAIAIANATLASAQRDLTRNSITQQATRASVPTAAAAPASSVRPVDPQPPLMKPPAPRGVSRPASQLEGPSIQQATPSLPFGGTSGPASSIAALGRSNEAPNVIYYQDVEPSRPTVDTSHAARNSGSAPVTNGYQDRAPRLAALSTNTTTSNGGGSTISYYREQTLSAVGNTPHPPATSTTVRSSAVNRSSTANPANPVSSAASAEPVIIYYQDAPMTAQSIMQANAIRYHRNTGIVPPGEQSEPSNNFNVIYYQDPPSAPSCPEASNNPNVVYYQDPPTTSSRPETANSAGQTINLVQPVRNAVAQNTQASQTHEMDLMDLDDAPVITSFPVLGTNDAQNREETLLGNYSVLEPQHNCTCPPRPRGLGNSRWADPYGSPVVEEGHFALAPRESQPAPNECPVHRLRPMSPLTPTAPEFVPRSGHTSASLSVALSMQAPTQISTPTPNPSGSRAPGGTGVPWLL